MRYAIIETGGKQFKISEGDSIKLERQDPLSYNVLAYSDDSGFFVGSPYLKDVEVKIELVENKLDKKVVVARFKAKSRYRKKKGHRQPISIFKVESVKKIDQGVEMSREKERKSATKTASKSKGKAGTVKKRSGPKKVKMEEKQ